jgi:NADH-quinone oxidoreductase subunit K
VILLLAIVAAIRLTLRRRPDNKYVDPARRCGCARVRTGCGWSRWPPRTWSRRRGPAENRREPMIALSDYLILAAGLFMLAVAGIFLNRKNVILLLMCIELMLLAVNMNFVAFSHFLGDMTGQVFVFFILTVAAAEAAIGLAILVVLFRNRRTINVEDLDALKG